MVDRGKLFAVCSRLADMLHLRRDRGGAACTQRGDFSGDRANTYAAGSAIEAYTVRREIAHAAVVYVVVNDTGVNVVH